MNLLIMLKDMVFIGTFQYIRYIITLLFFKDWNI